MELFKFVTEKINSLTNSFRFIALVICAFVASWIPLINIPLDWITIYFHEISHGLAALFTGGSIEKIVLYLRPWKEAGLCYTIGGISFLIAFSGYLGAVLWGILIYEMADNLSDRVSRIISQVFAGMIALTAILYGKDLSTWIILIILCGFFVGIAKFQDNLKTKLALKFTGVYVLLDAITAPLALFDGRHIGDGAKLSDLTMLPEFFWMVLWVFLGLFGLFYLWNSVKIGAEMKIKHT